MWSLVGVSSISETFLFDCLLVSHQLFVCVCVWFEMFVENLVSKCDEMKCYKVIPHIYGKTWITGNFSKNNFCFTFYPSSCLFWFSVFLILIKIIEINDTSIEFATPGEWWGRGPVSPGPGICSSLVAVFLFPLSPRSQSINHKSSAIHLAINIDIYKQYR